MKYIFILLPIFIGNTLNAQIRYLDSLFEFEKSHQALEYGNAKAINFPFLFENFTRNKSLETDIYQPQNDTLSNRACIIVAHGGAFVTGSRKNHNIKKACQYLATKGYVVFSIDYRMGYNTLSGKAAERAVYRGIQDMKTAIRFVKEHATTFRIDTNLVFSMGASAGSIMSIHAAYFDEAERKNIPSSYNKPDLGCLSCSGNEFKHNDKPIAIANLWGAFIDTIFINKENIPMISFHGTKDIIVSPDSKSPIKSPFFKPLSGSNILTPRLENLGIKTQYKKFHNKKHGPWGMMRTKPEFDTIMNQTSVFFFNVLVNNTEHKFETVTIDYNLTNKKLSFQMKPIENDTIKIRIINTLGKSILTNKTQNFEVNNRFEITIGHLPKGKYYLIINNGNRLISKEFSL